MLLVLTLLVGVIQLALGLLKLGWITKFVSNAVMVGFITGVRILIILGQLGDLTGYSSEYSNKVAKTVDLLFHLGEIDWPTLAVGLATIGLILLLDRTAVRKFSMVLAFIAATVATAAIGLTSVALVGDIATIPSGLPQFKMPDLTYLPQLVVPAIAIAVIGLVSESEIEELWLEEAVRCDAELDSGASLGRVLDTRATERQTPPVLATVGRPAGLTGRVKGLAYFHFQHDIWE